MSDAMTGAFAMRPMEDADFPVISGWFLDLDDLSRFDRSMRVPLAPDALRKSWSGVPGDGRPGNRHWFAITDEGNRPVGMVGFEHICTLNRDAVVPMFIDRRFRGRGIGTRSLALAMDIGFEVLGLRRLTTYLREDNEPSRSMTGRLGFRQEGCIRQGWFLKGRHLDMLVVGILRDEWIERRNSLARELDSRTVVSFGRNASENWSWPPSVEQCAAGEALA